MLGRDWCEMAISAIENVAADFMRPGHRVIWDHGSRGLAPLAGHNYSMSSKISTDKEVDNNRNRVVFRDIL